MLVSTARGWRGSARETGVWGEPWAGRVALCPGIGQVVDTFAPEVLDTLAAWSHGHAPRVDAGISRLLGNAGRTVTATVTPGIEVTAGWDLLAASRPLVRCVTPGVEVTAGWELLAASRPLVRCVTPGVEVTAGSELLAASRPLVRCVSPGVEVTAG